MVNTGLALGVTFDMVTKPSSIPVATGILAVGALVAGVAALRQHEPQTTADANTANGFAST